MGDTTINTIEIATWVGAIATFLAVIVALFKDEIINSWRRPKLEATIRPSAPDCHKTKMTFNDPSTGVEIFQGDCYYLRIWVENKGKQRAEKVQVFAAKLLRCHDDSIYREEKQFLPMNLKWSHTQQLTNGPEIFADGISSSMGKHCDLGHIMHPEFRKKIGENLTGAESDQTILALDTEVAPNTLSHLITPGLYRLEIKIAAANSKPVKRIIEINLSGKWHDDESKMFSEGIGIKELN